MITFYQIVVPNIMQEGFSAFISSASASTDLPFTDWSVTAPYFASPNFNATTGIYTVPVTGRYSIEAIINYNTATAIVGSIGVGVNPAFEVNRTSPATTILSGLLPLNNLNLALLSLRAVLGGGAVTLAGEASLSVGETLGLYYNASTMSLTLNFSNVVWSVYRIT